MTDVLEADAPPLEAPDDKEKPDLETREGVKTFLLSTPVVGELLTDLETHHEESFNHLVDVALIASKMGKQLGYNDERIERLAVRAGSHDMGKIGVPEAILRKKDLSPQEFNQIKLHPLRGFTLLMNKYPDPGVAWIALYHHSLQEGRNYPQNLPSDPFLEDSDLLDDLYITVASDIAEAITSGKREYLNMEKTDRRTYKLSQKIATWEFLEHFMDLPKQEQQIYLDELKMVGATAEPLMKLVRLKQTRKAYKGPPHYWVLARHAAEEIANGSDYRTYTYKPRQQGEALN